MGILSKKILAFDIDSNKHVTRAVELLSVYGGYNALGIVVYENGGEIIIPTDCNKSNFTLNSIAEVVVSIVNFNPDLILLGPVSTQDFNGNKLFKEVKYSSLQILQTTSEAKKGKGIPTGYFESRRNLNATVFIQEIRRLFQNEVI